MFDIFSGGYNGQAVMNIRKNDSSIVEDNIGAQSTMSASDIKALNRAYSCDGTSSSNGGGNFKVLYIVKKG